MELFATNPLTLVYGTIAILFVITTLSIMFRGKLSHKECIVFFLIFTIPVAITTLYLAGDTIHKNIVSETKGPIHWHADYQIWVCGERLDLIDPEFPSNKIGSPLFHEHNDDRIHVEGAVKNLEDVDVGSFFGVIGGRLTSTQLVYNTENKGIVDVTNGDLCNGEAAQLSVYVNGARIQDPANYLYYPDAYVPPGDCIIVEFGPNLADRTERICESWSAKDWDYSNFQSRRGDDE